MSKIRHLLLTSYISVSSKPSKIFEGLRRFGRNQNITRENKCHIFDIHIYIYIYIYIYSLYIVYI